MNPSSGTPPSNPIRSADPRQEKPKHWLKMVLGLFLMAILVGVSAAVVTWGVLRYFLPHSENSQTAALNIRPPQAPAIIPTLTVWACGNETEEVLWREAINVFEGEHRSAVFVQIWRNQVEYENAVHNLLGTSQGPDIALVRQSLLEGFRRKQVIQVLPWNDQEIMSWVPASIDAVRHENGILALPSRISVPALYYNPQLFDIVGIAHPDNHWTWENLLSIARVLHKPGAEGQIPARYGLEANVNTELWNTLSLQAGGPLWGDRLKLYGGAGATEPQTQTLQWLIELIQNYSIWTPAQQSPLSSRFENGQAAMMIAGPEFLPKLRAQTTVRWNVSPLPKFNSPAVTLEVSGWCIAQKTNDTSAAMKLARRLVRATDRNLHLPAFQPDPVHLMTLPTSAFYDQLQYARPLPNHPLSFDVQKSINRSLKELSGETNSSALLVIESINQKMEHLPDWRIYQKETLPPPQTNP